MQWAIPSRFNFRPGNRKYEPSPAVPLITQSMQGLKRPIRLEQEYWVSEPRPAAPGQTSGSRRGRVETAAADDGLDQRTAGIPGPACSGSSFDTGRAVVAPAAGV